MANIPARSRAAWCAVPATGLRGGPYVEVHAISSSDLPGLGPAVQHESPPLGDELLVELSRLARVLPEHLIADRIARRNVETKDVFDVKPGEGKIASIDGRKIAVYRTENGALHAISPVCTHMKCDVAWNAAEKTWDCPCHGSRFTTDGDVLNGPAKKPLKKLKGDE